MKMNKFKFRGLAIFMVMILLVGVLGGCAKKPADVLEEPKPGIEVNESKQ